MHLLYSIVYRIRMKIEGRTKKKIIKEKRDKKQLKEKLKHRYIVYNIVFILTMRFVFSTSFFSNIERQFSSKLDVPSNTLNPLLVLINLIRFIYLFFKKKKKNFVSIFLSVKSLFRQFGESRQGVKYLNTRRIVG